MTGADRDVATIGDFATMQDFIFGRLSDAERRAFEDRLVSTPELVRELEHSLRMREGLQRLRTQGDLENTASPGRPRQMWLPALIAAAGAGLALFLWLSRISAPAPILTYSLESRSLADVARSVTAHFTFVSVRGGSTPDLDLPSAGLIEIRAAPGTRHGIYRYRATLARQEEEGPAKPVAELADLALDADGYVHCYADAARLSRGSYVLRIEPDTGTPGAAEVFPFNLRARVTESVR
jgi:hypothetical protein